MRQHTALFHNIRCLCKNKQKRPQHFLYICSLEFRIFKDKKYQQVSAISKSAVILAFQYRKNSKNWDTLNYYRDCPTNVIVGFYSTILRSKDADRITNSVDTDQTAPWGAV